MGGHGQYYTDHNEESDTRELGDHIIYIYII